MQFYIDDLLIELLHTLNNSQSKKIALIIGFKKNAETEIARNEAGGLKLTFGSLSALENFPHKFNTMLYQ